MAIWKVIADRITILPHPNATSLALGKVGPFQVVVALSNGYQDGDVVVFAPERSELPDDLKGSYVNSETGISYLSGPDQNRVKRVRLRGEFSEGVTIEPAYVERKLGIPLSTVPLAEDLSAALGITKYEAPIPANMAGEIVPIDAMVSWQEHDVEQFRLYSAEFKPGEDVLVHEKMHGSQLVLLRTADGTVFVTSKGFSRKRQAILENDSNLYWRAVRETALVDRIAASADLATVVVQVFAEAFPCQGPTYAYGQTKPTLRVYRLFVDGVEWSVDQVAMATPLLYELWAPLLYRGPYDLPTLVALASGKEQVSGKEANIREGIVVAPAMPRSGNEGFPLFLKIINPAYKDSDEFIS